MSRKIAIILGAGPGLGASVARALGKTHSVLLLARSLPGSLPSLKLDLPEDRVLACTSDASRESFKAAIAEMKKRWPDGKVDVGVFNMGGQFAPKSFLEVKEGEFDTALQTNACV